MNQSSSETHQDDTKLPKGVLSFDLLERDETVLLRGRRKATRELAGMIETQLHDRPFSVCRFKMDEGVNGHTIANTLRKMLKGKGVTIQASEGGTVIYAWHESADPEHREGVVA